MEKLNLDTLAMEQLTDRLLKKAVISKPFFKRGTYVNGYNDAISDAINLINHEIAEIEKRQIVLAYSAALPIEEGVQTSLEKGLAYFEEKYTKIKK